MAKYRVMYHHGEIGDAELPGPNHTFEHIKELLANPLISHVRQDRNLDWYYLDDRGRLRMKPGNSTTNNHPQHPDDYTTDQLLELAEQHITRYRDMMNSGNSYVRVSECAQLSKIWEAIKRAATDGLTYKDMKPWPSMRQEIYDVWYENSDL